jgi:hypothetical protein
MGPDTANETRAMPLDTKLLSNLVYQLNIVRRQVGAYPPGHQVVRASAERTIKILENLKISASQVTIGVARDRLMLGGAPLDPKNPVYREYAQALFAHGIISQTLQYGLSAEELCQFSSLLACKPEELLTRGGIAEAMLQAGLQHLSITLLDDSRFATRAVTPTGHPEESAKTNGCLWEQFVRSMLTGSDAEGFAPGVLADLNSPRGLAGQVSEAQPGDEVASMADYDQAIITFLRGLDREQLSRGQHDEMLDRFRDFIGALHTPLRRQFLSSTFFALTVHEESAGRLLSRFPGAMLMDALDDLNARQVPVSSFILQVLSKLPADGAGFPLPGQGGGHLSDAEAEERLKLVFAEHQAADFVPEDYQMVLGGLPSPGAPPVLPADTVAELLAEIHEQALEHRLCAIVSYLLQHDPDGTDCEDLTVHLQPFVQHFIATGDFAALIDLYRQLTDGEEVARHKQDGIFARHGFLREIIGSIPLWFKEKRQDILHLIRVIGPPFAPLLLDQLAEEPDRALRQQYLALLAEMGPEIRQEVAARLSDDRWQLVRNLVVLLRGLQDPQIVTLLEPLFRHPHESVRQEVLKTAFFCKDQHADPALLQELEGSGALPPLWAIGLARYSRDVRVRERLLQLLHLAPLTKEGLLVQLAAVTALGQLGRPEALPELEQLLCGFSVRHPRRYRILQRKILESLTSYPLDEVLPIYRRLAGRLRPDLAEMRRRAARHLEAARV